MRMSRIKVGGYCLGPVRTNTYIVCRETDEGNTPDGAVIIDPAEQGEAIYDAVTESGLTVEAVLITHAHFDHIMGIDGILSRKKVPVYAADTERALCGNAEMNQSAVLEKACTVEPDEWLADGQRITLAGMTFQVIHTPGHTPGSCCYYLEEGPDRILFSGDTLFQASVGRTDLPGGSADRLTDSVRKLYAMLPDDTHVYPGHGESTYIGFEKKYNPFVFLKE